MVNQHVTDTIVACDHLRFGDPCQPSLDYAG